MEIYLSMICFETDEKQNESLFFTNPKKSNLIIILLFSGKWCTSNSVCVLITVCIIFVTATL